MVLDSKEYIDKEVEVKGKGNVFDGAVKGIVVPNENKDLLVLKLPSGYNIAVKKENISSISVLNSSSKEEKTVHKVEEKEQREKPKFLKKIAIVSLGGTIASRVDYKTGGVSSQFRSEDLVLAIPEIQELCEVVPVPLLSKFSEDFTDKDWLMLASKIEELVKAGIDGVLVTEGTDVMHYSSACLSFLLEELGVPVVFVAAQRSSDRPSADTAYNLLGALTFIVESQKAGVFIAMHNTSDDKQIAIHLGTRVRKMHTSRRDAFQSINSLPIALVNLELLGGGIHSKSVLFNSGYDSLQAVVKKKIVVHNKLDPSVVLLKFVPDLDLKLFEFVLKNYKAVVVEGGGFGQISYDMLDLVKKHPKILVFMTSQTIFGRVNLDIYTKGREEVEAGIIGLEDMLSEVAFVKAKYLLSKYKDSEKIKEMMKQNLKGEITERTIF